MLEEEAWVVRSTGEALPARPVRVLDGGTFTQAAPGEVRTPRFLAAATRPAPARGRAPSGR
jgi:hypothetical protein